MAWFSVSHQRIGGRIGYKPRFPKLEVKMGRQFIWAFIGRRMTPHVLIARNRQMCLYHILGLHYDLWNGPPGMIRSQQRLCTEYGYGSFTEGAGRYMCHNMSHQYHLSMVLITGPALITTLTLVRVPQPHRWDTTSEISTWDVRCPNGKLVFRLQARVRPREAREIQRVLGGVWNHLALISTLSRNSWDWG